MGDLNYIDVNEFVRLQTCLDNLSKRHDILNQNLTMLTALITNFIKIHSPQDAVGHAQVPPQALVHVGTSSTVPPSHVPIAQAVLPPHPSPAHARSMQDSMQDTHMVFIEDPTEQTVEVLKNLKPPGFKGEDKE